jgi:hypothetical protein
LKPLGSSKEKEVRSSTLTVEAVAVETSARKSKREKRLFRLNVPTAICTSLLTRRNGRLYFIALEVKEGHPPRFLRGLIARLLGRKG